MSEYRQELNLRLTIDEIAAKIQHQVDQAALDKAADTLAEFGYVKVVRCRDCEKWDYDSKYPKKTCFEFSNPEDGYTIATEPDGFCAWSCRKESE